MKVLLKIPTAIAGGALTFLVSVTVLSVVARYVFDAPLHWLEEVSGLLMIWIIMVGAIVTERDGQHLTIPMLTDALPRRLRAAVEVAIGLLSLVVLVYVAWLGAKLAIGARDKLTDILEISWFWIDVAVPVGAVGVVLYMAIPLRRSVAVLFGAEEAEQTTSTPAEGGKP
jgi:TRAP-type C4-dicarboxylate transport system permease small subunit